MKHFPFTSCTLGQYVYQLSTQPDLIAILNLKYCSLCTYCYILHETFICLHVLFILNVELWDKVWQSIHNAPNIFYFFFVFWFKWCLLFDSERILNYTHLWWRRLILKLSFLQFDYAFWFFWSNFLRQDLLKLSFKVVNARRKLSTPETSLKVSDAIREFFESVRAHHLLPCNTLNI